MQKFGHFPAYIRGALGTVIAYAFGQQNNRIILDINNVRPRKARFCVVCNKPVETGKDAILLDCATGLIPAASKRFSLYAHQDCYQTVACKLAGFIEQMHSSKPDLDLDLWNITQSILNTKKRQEVNNDGTDI